ncbi:MULTISPECIES: ABC transporter permease [Amycolatopsis]|uniref:Transport permease protein n=2 Tax=Amycolatopsis TaxID=1813 RepID=A0A2A9F8I6_9PSEU|nr:MULTISPECIES: ABC transporter permease [Amycolatopsis]PFG47081.1 ABC-2 type transport system permease protein [Amycolatopsis sulphurea]RJQ82170.1 ABC transporter permease [Amycolatopsis panacis]
MRDSMIMVRRNLKHLLRYPSMTVMLVAMPVIFLLLFVYVFGGTLGAGIGGGSGGRATYIDYVTPGVLLMAIAGAVQGTAVSVAMDMTQGIMARFRTMAISRGAVLTGHVVSSCCQAMLCVGVTLGLAVAIGFRPSANLLQWLGALGMLLLLAFALTWLTVALGMVTKSVEGASNLPMPLILLPFLGSGFVPTDSMPAGLRWFAQYQPFTPVMETARALLRGTPVGSNLVLALGWCAVLSLGGYLWARRLFERNLIR